MTSDRDASGDSDADEITLSVDELDALVEAKVDERLADADAADSAPSDAEPTDTASTDETGDLSRRGLLGLLGSGAAGFGLASVTDSVAGDSAGALDGRDVASDFEVANLQTQTIDTEVLNTTVLNAQRFDGVRYASEFSGKNGGEMIQNAIDDSSNKGDGKNVIFVSPEGPDTWSPSSPYHPRKNAWTLTSPLELPSNIVLLLNGCFIALDDGVDDNIITNKNHDGDNDIHIVSHGATIHGNGANNNGDENLGKDYGIYFINVENLLIEGIELRNTDAWGIVPENVTHGRFINNVVLQDNNSSNQDCIHGNGPLKDIIINGLIGRGGDDIVGIGHEPKRSDYGPIRNIHITNIHGQNIGIGGLFRIHATSDAVTERVILSNSTMTEGNRGLKLGSGVGTAANQMRDLLFSDLQFRNCNTVIECYDASQSVSVQNIIAREEHTFVGGENDRHQWRIDGVVFHNSGDTGQVFDLAGTQKDIHVQNVCVVGGGEYVVKIPNNSVLENVTFQNSDFISSSSKGSFKFGVFIDADASINGPVRFENVVMRNMSQGEYNLGQSNSVVIDGYGFEKGDNNRPTPNIWPTGSLVEYVDISDGTGTGVYFRKPPYMSDYWIKIV